MFARRSVGLALGFSPGFLVPERAFPFEVPLDLARTLPPKVQQMIGFRSFHNSSNAAAASGNTTTIGTLISGIY